MIFLKQKYAALVAFLILTGSTTGLAQVACMQNFLRVSQYDQQFVEIAQNTSTRTGITKGSVFVVGRSSAWEGKRSAEILGGLYYTIQGHNLRITQAIDRQELRGGDIFFQLFQKLLEKNPQVKKVSMNVGSQTVSLEQMNKIVNDPSSQVTDSSLLNVLDRLGMQVDRAQVIPVGENHSLVMVLSFKKFNEEYTEH